jgi:hypothetical protein
MNETQAVIKTIVELGFRKALVRNPVTRNLAKDVSTGDANFGDTIQARAAGDLSVTDVDLAAGLGAGTAMAFRKYPVTLNQFKKIGFSVNSLEATKDSKIAEVIEEQSTKLADGLGTAITLAALGLVTAANYDLAENEDEVVIGNSPITAALGGAERKTVIDAGVKLSNKEIEEEGRYGLINPTMYGELSEDEVVARSDANAGSNAIQTGKITKVHGFDIGEYSRMPSTGNLRGIFAHRDAFIFASRLPRDIQAMANAPKTATFIPVTDPVTGLQAVWYEYYDADKMTLRRFLLVMFGVGVARPEALVRVISA